MRYYSCDSHVVEPPEVFAGLEGRFGERAPQIVIGHQGRPGEFVLLPGSPPIPVGRLGIAGNRLDDPATQERITLGYAGLNPGVLDPHRRRDDWSASAAYPCPTSTPRSPSCNERGPGACGASPSRPTCPPRSPTAIP